MIWKWANVISRMDRLNRELKWAKAMADDATDTLKAQNVTGMPRSGKQSDLADVVAAHERLKDSYDALAVKIAAEIEELIRFRNAMESVVSNLSSLQERIIEYRYVDGHSWQWIAMKTNYDESQARRIERQALDYVAEHLEVE